MAASYGQFYFSKSRTLFRNLKQSPLLLSLKTNYFSTSRSVNVISREKNPPPLPAGEIDDDFRVLVIPGHTDVPEKKKATVQKRKQVAPPRYKKMPVDQDWTNVWPTAHSFKWSVVPLPIRMGWVQGNHENEGIPPGKYANAELMKLPNFLHLSPVHVKKHCQAIKKFCTKWPEGLETDEDIEKHFPITITTRDYVKDDMSVRDPRAKLITLTVKLSSLQLDYHARDKLLRLVGKKYDPKTDLLTINTDRCPLKRQNIDYAEYLLTVLFHESWKVEQWETDKEIADMEKYFWDIMPSKTSIIETIKRQKSFLSEKVSREESPAKDGVTTEGVIPEHLQSQNDLSDDQILNLEVVQKYRDAVSELQNEGETLESLDKYKQTTVQLLLGQKQTAIEKS